MKISQVVFVISANSSSQSAGVFEKARAKINLALNIVGLYPDGYHQVEMIMQTISLADCLKLTAISEGLELEIVGGEIENDLSEDSSNLAWQAARLLKDKFPQKISGVRIELEKNIPVAAGLAGGSADAAAVLRGLNSLFGLQLSRLELEELGAELGMDVPFCIAGGTALARGRGEELKSLPDLPAHRILLVNPEVEVSTAEVYNLFDELFYHGVENIYHGVENKKAIFDSGPGSDSYSLESLLELIKGQKSISWQEGWYNLLQPVTFRLVPGLAELEEKLYDSGAAHVQMTGSGPTLIAYFSSEGELEEALNSWQGQEKVIPARFSCRYSFE